MEIYNKSAILVPGIRDSRKIYYQFLMTKNKSESRKLCWVQKTGSLLVLNVINGVKKIKYL
jgi:hypothetical protein